MRDDISHLVKNIIIASLLLITFSSISVLLITDLGIKSAFRTKILDIVVDSSFLGSFLGALLSGSIALTVLLIQFYNNKKLRVEDDYKKYFKYIYPLIVKLDRLLEDLTDEKIQQMVDKLDKFGNRNIVENISEILTQIHSIEDIIFPEISLDFEIIKLTLAEIQIIIGDDIELILDNADEKSVITGLKANTILLTNSKYKLDKKIEEARRILKMD
ncbi:hypothetical protein [Sporosarcina sp. FSL K6-3508]|uniref:hypothetical protein n=1 Tax=Sporosarcina sp. FSL K6-3508 TaxID=2921557 RepID=UPI003159FA62